MRPLEPLEPLRMGTAMVMTRITAAMDTSAIRPEPCNSQRRIRTDSVSSFMSPASTCCSETISVNRSSKMGC